MVYSVKGLADFNAQLEAAGSKLVVLVGTWRPGYQDDGFCKKIAPHIRDMSKTNDSIVFLEVIIFTCLRSPNSKMLFQVDVDDCEDIAAEYNIIEMPTFIFIKNKAKVADLTGANVDKLKEIVAANK